MCLGDQFTTLKKWTSEHIIAKYNSVLAIDVGDYFNDILSVKLNICKKCGLEFFTPKTIQATSDFYEKLSKDEKYYQEDKWEYKHALSFLNEGHKLLEIGCGQGNFIKIALSRGIDCRGLDTAKTLLNLSQEIKEVISDESIAAHASSHPGEYDRIVAFQVLEHVNEPNTFIKDCLKCLKKGGKLIIAVPNNDARILKYDENNCLNLPPHHMLWFRKSSLISVAKIFDLEIDSFKKEPISSLDYKRYYRINAEYWRRNFGFLGKAIDKILYPISISLILLLKGLLHGQSMVIVFKKKKS